MRGTYGASVKAWRVEAIQADLGANAEGAESALKEPILPVLDDKRHRCRALDGAYKCKGICPAK